MFGGIETILSTLAHRRATAPDMEPEFAVCFSGRLSDQLSEAGCIVHNLGQMRVSRPWTIIRAQHRLARLLSDQHFDLAVTHACWIHALLGGAVQRRLPVIFWGHDINYGEHWIEKWAARIQPCGVIANSESTQASIQEHLFRTIPSNVLYCPIERPPAINQQRREILRREFGASDETFVIIQAGRLEGYKGLHIHLDALASLPQSRSWQSWIVGGAQRDAERQYLSELKKLVERRGLSARVRFLGQRTDVASILQAGDAFCHPNVRAEPFGIVFIEALFAGLPIVATNLGGAKEIVTNDCGILVAPNDAEALAGALRHLLDDRNRRRELGANGPGRAAELCDVNAQMLSLENILRAASLSNRKELLHA
ncbi:glycosyltransferase [Blastopirellula marina]